MRIFVILACLLCATTAGADPKTFTVKVSGKGRPVILIPGLGCPASVWDDTEAHLKGRFEVHTINVAGFAGTRAAGGPVISAVRKELASYITEKKLVKPVVVGHSMGGFLALWLAETDPALIGGVVVVDSGPTFGGGDPDMMPYAKKQYDAYLAMPRDKFEAVLREKFAAMFGEPKKNEAIIAAVTKSDQNAYAEAYWELSSVDLRPDLPKITAPTIAVFADEPGRDFYRKCLAPVKQLEVVTIPGSKHFLMQDTPAAWLKTLDAFLAAH